MQPWKVLVLAVAALRSGDGRGNECPSRSETLLRMLASTARGRELLPYAEGAEIRFEGGESKLVGRDTIVLSSRDDDRRSAARLAHLLIHRADASSFDLPASRQECAAWGRRVHGLEERAHALENEVAVELGGSRRVSASADLEATYRARCEEARR